VSALRKCSTCDSAEHLQDSYGQGGLNDVCLACFYIWLDGCGPCERPEHGHQKPHVHGEDIRDFCLKAKAEGKWPFDGHQLPALAP
jgi:hypothetical protein